MTDRREFIGGFMAMMMSHGLLPEMLAIDTDQALHYLGPIEDDSKLLDGDIVIALECDAHGQLSSAYRVMPSTAWTTIERASIPPHDARVARLELAFRNAAPRGLRQAIFEEIRNA